MSRVRQGVRFALFQAGRGADRVASLSHYLAAGTLRLAEMKDSIRQTWSDFYDRHPAFDAGLLPWEEDLVERFVPAGARVLLIGCGSGRDLLAFAERGYEVTGVEPAASALLIARRTLLERRLSATLVEGFFEDVPIPGAFDVVIFSFYCYTFIPESRRRIESLRKAAALLKPGGHILISHASTSVRPRRIVISLARMIGALCGSDWRLEAGDLVWDTRASAPAYSYSHTFGSGELECEAAAASLAPVFHRQTLDNVVVALMGRP
ncbi:MAG TPA: class I SAM-dependent methyltransferase [Vicinamibacterales bacterium]|jgi:SAM-dependent methyltransferase|nr:class I SAM-dependent methyltransferase [Vicinamibacterales bacterium]